MTVPKTHFVQRSGYALWPLTKIFCTFDVLRGQQGHASWEFIVDIFEAKIPFLGPPGSTRNISYYSSNSYWQELRVWHFTYDQTFLRFPRFKGSKRSRKLRILRNSCVILALAKSNIFESPGTARKYRQNKWLFMKQILAERSRYDFWPLTKKSFTFDDLRGQQGHVNWEFCVFWKKQTNFGAYRKYPPH